MFRNTPLTQKYLVEGQATFIGSYLHMFDALSYHRWEQMGAALRHNGPVDDLSHPYRYLADDAEEPQRFPRRSTLARAASGMPWHAGSISRPLRVSSTWEGALVRTQWQSSTAIHTCVLSSSISPGGSPGRACHAFRRGSRTACISLAVIMNTMCCRQARMWCCGQAICMLAARKAAGAC